MEILRYLVVVVAVMALFAPALSAEWGEWEWECEYGEVEESSNFLVFVNDTKYYSSGGFMELFVRPKIEDADFLEDYSELRISESTQPLLPAFDFPSDEFLAYTYRTGSFFVPYIPSTWDEPFEFLIAANSSLGELKCTLNSWIPLEEITDDLPLMEAFNSYAAFDPATRHFNFVLEPSCPSDDVNEICWGSVSAYLVVFDTQTNRVSEVRNILVVRPGGSGDTLTEEFPSTLEYDSYEVSTGRYTTYIFAFDIDDNVPTNVYFTEVPNFQFRDFEVEVGTVPNIVPGESLEIHLTLKNVGTLIDDYDYITYAPDLWMPTLHEVNSLDAGEDNQVIIRLDVPEHVFGDYEVILNVVSEGTGLSRNYTIALSPEKTIYLVPTLVSPLSLTAYDSNPLNVTFLFEATLEPRVFWTVYTEPALLITKGHGYTDLLIGSTINKAHTTFDLGGSCAFGLADTDAFNAGRRMLIYSLTAYDLTSTVSNETLESLNSLLALVDDEKLLMASTTSTKLFTRTEKLANIIEDIVDVYSYDSSTSRKKALREDLYLFTLDFENELQSVGEKMAEDCTVVDEVTFYLYVFSKDTLEDWTNSRRLVLDGSTVLELIGPTEVKAIAGDSTIVEYVVKNSAGEDFEVYLEPSSDIVQVTPYFFLEAGELKTVDFKFRPPDYYEVQGEKIFVEISTRSHTMNFPITLSTGEFDPQLDTEDVAVIPGTDADITFILETGGIDDIFDIASDCPGWVSLPETSSTFNGFGNVTVLMTPNANVNEDNYLCEIIATPKSFPDYRVREDFLISVSAEALTLRGKMASYQEWYDEVKESLERTNQIAIETYFDQANREINQGEYVSAKLALKRVENLLAATGQSENEGVSPIVFVAVGFILLLGFILWKFVLVKKPTSGQKDIDMGAGGGEVI
ncbi:MAG: hypothetical protein GOV00_00855 [Candidatus Altiarchaeota archaeon]|nr:hypothetical protein [Candidatus Altiarchaeota archaeon]